MSPRQQNVRYSIEINEDKSVLYSSTKQAEAVWQRGRVVFQVRGSNLTCKKAKLICYLSYLYQVTTKEDIQ